MNQLLDYEYALLPSGYPFPGLSRFTADAMDHLLGITPVDNIMNYDININWQSNINGQVLQSYFSLLNSYKKNLNRWGIPAEWADFWIDAAVRSTERAVARGEDPDPVAVDNLRIESAYAEEIKCLVAAISLEQHPSENPLGTMLTIDHEKCRRLCSHWEGQTWLLGKLIGFHLLERQYHSIGETRLKAYKQLLRSLLQVIAGQPLTNEKHQPYRSRDKDGCWRESDDQYLVNCEQRLLALLEHDAFDVRRFALTSPWAKIGFSHWEEVEGSRLNTAMLRYYPLPEGVQRNNITLYIASPMINRCDIFDLAPEKSVIEGMLKMGYDLYLVDYGDPGADQAHNGLDYYGKVVHDKYLDIIKARHPGQTLHIMAYCMGGTLMLPYLARRTEELAAEGLPIDVDKLVLMSTPILFDDERSGNKPMRDFLRSYYNDDVMKTFYGECNVPPQSIEIGMYHIQPGVPYTVYQGFFERAGYPGAIADAAPFLFWLNSGTRFPAKAHREWVRNFLENEIWEGRFCLSSRRPELDGKPVNMDILNLDMPNGQRIALFDYRGHRDPIAPPTACIASERWGRLDDNRQLTCGGLNRTIEKNIGHIFVVSKKLVNEFIEEVHAFLDDQGSTNPA